MAKNLPKKLKVLKDQCMNAIGTFLLTCRVKEEIEGPFNANQYFPIMKEGLEV